MSNKVLRIEPPTIEETSDEVGKLKLEPGQSDGDGMSTNLGPPAGDERRDSVHLSVMSGDSRRQSLFAEEDLEEEHSEGSEKEEDEEERKRKRDEMFVDKTRAAMVVVGAKDIKEALERQKAVEISRKTPEAKVAHILFHQARFLMGQSRFKEALVLINRALCVDPEQKEWMTEKSRCYLNLLQPQTALQYVDEVLKKEPRNFKAIVLKGEILYSLWDLEKSMLYFVEGRRMRPDNTECIKGVHKVRMALEEIAAFRVPPDERKKKSSKKRSKSAKGRLSDVSVMDSVATRNRDRSLSSRRPSSRLSPLSEADLSSRLTSQDESPSTARPSTSFVRRRIESPSISHSPMLSEQRTPIERPMTAKGKRGALNRPKTAVGGRRSRSKSTPRDLEIDDIRRFVKESMSGSYKTANIKRFSEGSPKSDQSGFSSRSYSSSMEDVSNESEYRQYDRHKLPKVKTKMFKNELLQRNKKIPETKVSVFLGQDKVFLDSLLKDKDLKQSQTSYTKRALKIAREVQNFVSDREKYWKNRENFTRYTTTQEDTLL